MFGRNKKGGRRRFSKGLRRTYGSKRKYFKRKSVRRQARNARRNFGISTTRWLGGRINNRPELKYLDFINQDLVVPHWSIGEGYASPAVFDVSQLAMTQGTGKAQFTGKHINIKNLEVSFKLVINPKAFPISYQNPFGTNQYGLLQAYWERASNLTPKVRISIIQQREGTGVTLNTAQLPAYEVLGFTAPWDIDKWKVIEDKYYTLKPGIAATFAVTGANAAGGFGSYGDKFVILIKKRIPMSQTAEMVARLGEVTPFYPTINKKVYIVMTTDATWQRPEFTAFSSAGVSVTQTAQSYINVIDARSRIWFRDP